MKERRGTAKRMKAVVVAIGLLGTQYAAAFGWEDVPYFGWNDKEVRQSYNRAVTKAFNEEFAGKAADFHRRGQSMGEELAQEAVAVRNKIKLEHHRRSSYFSQLVLNVRNLLEYRSWNYPSYEALREEKDPEEIFYGAFKTNGADLGLENNGFNDVIEVWRILRENGDLTTYPENINEDVVAYLKAKSRGKKLDKQTVLDEYYKCDNDPASCKIEDIEPASTSTDDPTDQEKSTEVVDDSQSPDTLPPPAASAIPDAVLAGEIYAATQSYLLESSHHVQDSVLNRVRAASADSTQTGAWGHGYGSWGHYHDQSHAKLTYRHSGVLVGADQAVGDWQLGVLGGYGQAKLTLQARDSHADVNSYHLGIYAANITNNWHTRVGTAYAWHRIKTTRHDQNMAAASDYHANTLQAFAEVSYPLTVASLSVEPLLNVTYVRLNNSAFRENGDDAVALSGGDVRQSTTFSTLGLRTTKTVTVQNTEVGIQASVGWRHAYGNVKPTAQLTLDGNTYGISGSALAKDAALIGLGVNMKVGKHTQLGVNYAGTVAKDARENAVQANMTWQF